jgi:hypothetical protein
MRVESPVLQLAPRPGLPGETHAVIAISGKYGIRGKHWSCGHAITSRFYVEKNQRFVVVVSTRPVRNAVRAMRADSYREGLGALRGGPCWWWVEIVCPPRKKARR